MFRKVCLPAIILAGIVLAGCPKNNQDFEEGRKAEAVQDYDTALVHYDHALRRDPTNAEYKLRSVRMHEMDGQFHLQQGEKLLKKGDLEMALAEFEKAQGVDPSNIAVQQQIDKVMQMVQERSAAKKPPAPPQEEQFLSEPPELKPIIHQLDGLKMTNNSNVVFETIAKLGGLSVIFDPEFHPQRISIELPRITIEQALDAVALESKAFWKPLTSDVILVAPDNPQKRRDMEDEVVRTFYISNTLQPTDLGEIATGLRSMLNITKIAQVNAQNALVVRGTPSQVAAAQKIIDSIDKAKPEVLIHVQVLSANRDRLRDLGILPGQTVTVQFTPRPALQPSTSSTSTSSNPSSTTTTTPTSTAQVTLNNLHSLGTADWSATLPGATATAILTDSKTQIIQDPELRVTDGEKAKLTIGEKVPIATGSFQAGVGVGVGGGAGVVNPLVNTQFTYQDVGVIIDVQPRVHLGDEISMKLSVDISSIAGTSNIGGINQPIIAQNKIEHEVRLRDGEASVLGGLIQRTETVNINGIPGLAQVPLMRYFFSDNQNSFQDQEVLIVLTPHIIRYPSITAEDLRSLDTGSDQNVRVYREADEALGTPTKADEDGGLPPSPAAPTPATNPNQPENGAGAQLQFDPPTATLKEGDSMTIGLKVNNVSDLYSIPLLIHYNPAIIQIQEIRNGGFLSGGTQDIAIVQHIDSQRGEAVVSTTRNPNTPGVSGTGTLFGIVVHAVGPGTSPIQILQVNARNSKQQTVPLASSEATIQVQQ